MADQAQITRSTRTIHRSTVGCVIPAHDEESSIALVLESLLGQTRVPDVIHVVVNNTSDGTVGVASTYAGPHEIATDLGEQFTEVFVHDIGTNPEKKAGALNYGYTLVEGHDYLLGVDGDTVADLEAVEQLESEASSDGRVGGVSAITTIDGRLAIFLTQALRDVMKENHMAAPWIDGPGGADSLLLRHLAAAGYRTKVVTLRQPLRAASKLIRRKDGYKI